MSEEFQLMDELMRLGNAIDRHVRPSTRKELIETGRDIFKILADKYRIENE